MNFRNAFIALTVMALFAGLASAQIPIPVAMNQIPCSVSASANPNIRAEGTAERVGDIVITCSSNLTETSGTAADRATITVNYGVPVTSHANAAVTVSNTSYKPSEVLLLIDEPNTVTSNPPVAQYGQNASVLLCAFNVSCEANLFIQSGFYTMSNAAASGPGANAYQGGIQTGSSNGKVTFFNVPIIPPGPNATRVFRIVNARVTPGSGAITPTVTVTAATGAVNGLALSNNSATVATPAASMTTSVSSVGGVSLCQSPQNESALVNANKLSLLTFKELYNNAWKTQSLPLTNVANAAENGSPNAQNVANGTYTYGSALLSETGVFSDSVVASMPIGVGNSGTRFKVVFTGLPQPGTPGTKFWISTTNVADLSNGIAAPTIAGEGGPVSGVGSQVQGAYAVMVSKGDNSNLANERASFGAVSGTTSFTNTINGTTINFVQVVPLSSGNNKGKAEVVYELTNLTKNAINTLNFALYVTYSNGTAAPAVGNTATVQLGYAPTDISDPNATTPVVDNWAPRFTAPAMTPATFFNVLPCQTSLLFPYVLGSGGYATGMAISNASADPYGTTTSTGTCKLDFYSSGATSASYTTPSSVAAGTTWSGFLTGNNTLYADSTSTTLTGFTGTGYMFATCNFQYAHGFAFIDKGDGTSSAMAMGYLAPVVSDTQRGIALSGESLGL